MRRALFALAVSVASLGCYPEPKPNFEAHPLTTSCGLMLESGDETDLARLQRQQDITLDALSTITTNVPWTRQVTCEQLKGTYVLVAPLADGGMWSDDQFFELKRGFDRGRYSAPYEAVVTTYNWANPELSWQLVRIITRGDGDVNELLHLTAPAIAEAAKRGRQTQSFTLPLEQP